MARHQRVVVGLLDGFGPEYLARSDMPELKRMAREGLQAEVQAVFPTVTNVNNVSICCGAWPEETGISANSYFAEESGRAVYMNAAALIQVPTLFERAAAAGVKSALLTCKRKTVELLNRGASLAIAAEEPAAGVVERYGPPGDIYSAGINHWLWGVAADLLRNRTDLGVLYVHTTDYPMHAWPAEAPESQAHLAMVDDRIRDMRVAAPEATFLVTADHGMNAKRRCIDLTAFCAEHGVPLRFAVSPVADRLVRHHRGFGGVSYAYLRSPAEEPQVTEFLRGIPGVEDVLPRSVAASRFRLMPERIGELVVLPDRDTVFGDLGHPREVLAPDYRNHGSLYEQEIPLLAHGPGIFRVLPTELRFNLDLTRRLYRE